MEGHDIDITLKAPFTMVVAGASQSGKSTLTAKLLKRRSEIISPPIDKIMYCYQEFQPKLFGEIKACIPSIEFKQGLPTQFIGPLILILDDLMLDVAKSEEMVKAFTVYSHHNNVSIIFLTQNFFEKGKTRSITLNCKYIVVFKNPRDTAFVNVLGRQMNGGKNNPVLQYAYNDTMSKKYGYLVIDLDQQQNDSFRFRSSLFPEDCIIYTSK